MIYGKQIAKVVDNSKQDCQIILWENNQQQINK